MIDDTLVATSRERELLQDLAEQLEVHPENQDEYCAQADTLSAKLPDRVSAFVDGFRNGQRAVMILSNLPTGRVPPTPRGNRSHVGQSTILARVQAIINLRLGSMVAYEAQAGGRLFHDIVPDVDESDLQTSLSYQVELDAHTEQCFSELRPDFLSLACLRSSSDAYTYVFAATELIRRMPRVLHETLFEPMWDTGVDTSFRMFDTRFAPATRRGPISLLSGDRNDPYVTVDETLTRGLSIESQRLLERVLELYHQYHDTVVLALGDLLVLDNNRCIHGRSPFVPRLDGTDRFLVRSFVVQPHRRVEFAMKAGSRMLLARFA